MSDDRLYTVQGSGEPIGPVDKATLLQMNAEGRLVGVQVIEGGSGRVLGNEELRALLAVAPPVMPTTPPVQPAPQPSIYNYDQPMQSPYQRPTVQTAAKDDPMRFVMPLNPSVWALGAGYLGLFSVTLIFAPFALIVGLVALKDLNEHPEKTGKGRAWFGVIMGGICTVIGLALLISRA
jgi:hypothetical protein